MSGCFFRTQCSEHVIVTTSYCITTGQQYPQYTKILLQRIYANIVNALMM